MIGKINTKGFNINGIIEQYTAGASSISAGDFVSYVNGFEEDSDTQLTSVSYTAMTISAVALSANKVFIAHGYGTSSSTESARLYGMVCTISGTTITAGTDTQILSDSYTGSPICATALCDNKVFIAHTKVASYNTQRYLYGIVCTISGTTISYGADTQLSTNLFSGNRLSATTLCADKIFIAHSYNTSTGTSVSQYSLYGMVCTISGTAISHGTDTQLVNNEYAGKKISAVALSSSKVFVAHSYGNYLYAYCTVCTINGTTITSGTMCAYLAPRILATMR